MKWTRAQLVAICLFPLPLLGQGCGQKESPETNEARKPGTVGTGPGIAPKKIDEQFIAKAPTPPPGRDALPTTGGMTAQEAKYRLQVANNLQMMALSLINFESNESTFPPADGKAIAQKSFVLSRPAQGKSDLPAGFSWRAQILHAMSFDSQPGSKEPSLQREVFFDLCNGAYPLSPNAKPGELWNCSKLKDLFLLPYSCEIPGKTSEKWLTFYRVFTGNGAAFEPGKQLTEKDFTDGLENTILVVEAGEAVPWPKPDELPYDPSKPLPKLGGQFPDGFYAAFGNGTVRFIKRDTDEKLIRAMITRNGGEKIAQLPPPVDKEALRKAAGLKD